MIIDNSQNTAASQDAKNCRSRLSRLAAQAQPYLQNFCVAPKWRRKGVGRAMLQMIEKVL